MSAETTVIVGAGQAGSDTAAFLRAGGYAGRVVLVGDEDALPYQRPPLSKGYLTGTTDDEEIPLRPASFYAEHAIEFLRGERVVEICRDSRRVTLAGGHRISYDSLCLATGARPRPLPVPGAGHAGVLRLRDLADAGVLRDGLRGARHLVVVGGGFIGLEVAATARRAGLGVTVVEAGPRLMGRAVSRTGSAFLADEHQRHGVRVLLSREVRALHADHAGHVRVAELDGGERVPADLVLVGVGVLPNAGLAADAGLAVGDGILVDRRLRTSDPAVYALGDCARFPGGGSGRMLRLESVQNASAQARCVAAAIRGEPAPYSAVPWFWTEQFDVRLQIAGITEGHDRAVISGDTSTGRFSVFCFQGDRLLGAESVNRTADHMITRKLLAADDPGLAPDDVSRPDFDLRTYQRRRQPA